MGQEDDYYIRWSQSARRIGKLDLLMSISTWVVVWWVLCNLEEGSPGEEEGINRTPPPPGVDEVEKHPPDTPSSAVTVATATLSSEEALVVEVVTTCRNWNTPLVGENLLTYLGNLTIISLQLLFAAVYLIAFTKPAEGMGSGTPPPPTLVDYDCPLHWARFFRSVTLIAAGTFLKVGTGLTPDLFLGVALVYGVGLYIVSQILRGRFGVILGTWGLPVCWMLLLPLQCSWGGFTPPGVKVCADAADTVTRSLPVALLTPEALEVISRKWNTALAGYLTGLVGLNISVESVAAACLIGATQIEPRIKPLHGLRVQLAGFFCVVITISTGTFLGVVCRVGTGLTIGIALGGAAIRGVGLYIVHKFMRVAEGLIPSREGKSLARQ